MNRNGEPGAPPSPAHRWGAWTGCVARRCRLAHRTGGGWPSACLLTWLLVLLVWLAGVAPAGGPGELLFQGTPETAKSAPAWDPATKPSATGHVYLLVQAGGTMTAAWLEAMEAAGLEPVRYVPNNAYIFRTQDGAKASGELPAHKVHRFFPLGPANRVAPETSEAAGKSAEDDPLTVAITLWPGEAADRVLHVIADSGGTPAGHADIPEQPFLMAGIPAGALWHLAELPEIEWIEPVSRITPRNDVTGAMVESGTPDQRPFRETGLYGVGQVVGHIDSTLNAASCFFVDPTGIPPGPGHRKLVRVAGANNPTTHGTHTAATIAGWRDGGTFQDAGIAPAARLSHANYDVLLPHRNEDVPENFGSLFGLLDVARHDGAAIHSNSWGDDQRASYTYLGAAADLFVFLQEDALVVFAATNEETLRSPENARNVLAVGASRRYPNTDARLSGGAGPTFDGRMKPDLFAPGEQVRSAYSGLCSTGTLSGTSMAAAAVSGGAALVREYFQAGRYPNGTPAPENAFTPTGALLKAVLLNGAQDLTQVDAYPSHRQGWGRLQLDRALPSGPDSFRRLYVEDHRASAGLGMRTGQSRNIPVLVKDRAEPLRVTLTWNDPPVSRAAQSTVVNDLDLQVIGPDGTFYRGNVFSGRQSVTGGARDTLNNVEQVHLPAPKHGLHQIVVEGTFVEPRNAPQGFALAVSGGILSPHTAPALLFAPGDIAAGGSAELYLLDPLLQSTTATVEVTGESGDSETFTLYQRFDGIYETTVPLAIAPPVPGNEVLEGQHGETFTARYTPGTAEATITLRAEDTDGPAWRLY